MRVLVTGGAGFIGSHLVEELLRRGDSVRVLDDFSTGRRSNLEGLQSDFAPGSASAHPRPAPLEIITGDLRDAETVREAVHGVNRIFHLAAFVSVPLSMEDPKACFSVNVGGTVGLMEAARREGVQRMVLSSSTAVYGDTDSFPTVEETPLHPLSPYALSKQVNELYARLYTQTLGLNVTCLRYYNVYGPRQRPDSDYAAAIPIFINRLVSNQPVAIFGDGRQSRDFIFVKDVVRANLLAAEAQAVGGEFNICTGQETSLMDLMEELSGNFPQPPRVTFEAPRPGDIYRSVGDPRKAAALLGFTAQTSLADGLAQTVVWMKGKAPATPSVISP